MHNTTGAPPCDLDLYGAEARADPAAAWRILHGIGPMVWLSRHGLAAAVGHDAVTAILRDHRTFRSGEGVSIDPKINPILKGSTLNSDPPAHDVSRAITFAPLTPKALETVRARVRAAAEEIALIVVAKGTFDAASELAPFVPLTVVRDLVGLGDGGHEQMLGWGAATFELMGEARERRDDALGRIKAMRRFLEDPATLAQLAPDGWAARATQAGLAQGMAASRAAELMRDYIAPSLDTTISAIGYGVWLFARHPEEWARLRADPGLMKNAIEEIVRLNTPIRAFTRYVETEAMVAGARLAAGSRVMVIYGAASRDPAKFGEPDRFDITRDARGHLGFGHGVHSCLGMHLARLEMAEVFGALLDRVARFELLEAPVAAVNATIHAWAEVKVRAVAG